MSSRLRTCWQNDQPMAGRSRVPSLRGVDRFERRSALSAQRSALSAQRSAIGGAGSPQVERAAECADAARIARAYCNGNVAFAPLFTRMLIASEQLRQREYALS